MSYWKTPNDFFLEVAKGDVPGHSLVHKFGEAGDIDTADNFVDIWDGTTDANADKTYTFSTSADIDSISSADAGDGQDVEIQGLDANWDLVVQTVTLNGQTKVALTTDLIRVFRMKNMGSTDFAGNVYCYVDDTITTGIPDTSNKIRAIVQAGLNQTLMAMYTIPNGKTGYIFRRWTALSSKIAGYSSVRSFARPFGGVFQLKYSAALATTGTSAKDENFHFPMKMPAKTDVKMMADSSVNNMAVSAGFDIILVDD